MQADEVQQKAKADKRKQPPADISKYLRPVGMVEMRYARLMASLCAETYDMDRLTVSEITIGFRLIQYADACYVLFVAQEERHAHFKPCSVLTLNQ